MPKKFTLRAGFVTTVGASCQVPDCDGKVVAKNMCGKHYQRHKASGTFEKKPTSKYAMEPGMKFGR